MTFSLVIPCYNEAQNLPLLLKCCREVSRLATVEIIFVDNGSEDNTEKILQEYLSNHLRWQTLRVEKNQGYGFGVIQGLKAATGDILGWIHADMQTDPKDFVRGMDIFKEKGEGIFVKGLRHGRPLFDVSFTVGMSVFESVLLQKPLWDINACPTMFSRRFFQKWIHPPLDFSLDLYAYYKAHKEGLAVHRFPVEFKQRIHGVSHWNVNWACKMGFIKRTIGFSWGLKKRVQTEYHSS